MVGKLPNCSQARRSRTEERKRDLWIRQSPPRSQSRAMLQAPSLNAASEGWMSENQILLADRKKYFCLDIPFYRTLPTLFGNPFRIPTFPRPRLLDICLLGLLNSSHCLRKGFVTDVSGPQRNACPGTLTP